VWNTEIPNISITLHYEIYIPKFLSLPPVWNTNSPNILVMFSSVKRRYFKCPYQFIQCGIQRLQVFLSCCPVWNRDFKRSYHVLKHGTQIFQMFVSYSPVWSRECPNPPLMFCSVEQRDKQMFVSCFPVRNREIPIKLFTILRPLLTLTLLHSHWVIV
jgi:hypothetical protein